MVKECIARLDTWYRKNRSMFYESLLPGLSQAELDELEAMLGVTLPDDFRTLYSWRNGQISAEAFGFEYGRFMDAMFIVQTWKSLEQVAEGIRNDELPSYYQDTSDWWNPKWIPFLDFETGDVLCVDTFGSYGGKPGQLARYVHDDEYRSVECSGTEGWLRTLVTALEENELSWDEWMETDIDTNALRLKTDPGYPKFFPPRDECADPGTRLYTPW